MDDFDKSRLDALDQRLKDMEARRQQPEGKDQAAAKISNMGIAYRMVIEMITGIGLGAAIGFGLDYLFNTQPWFLVIMTLFGFAAGIRVMMESAREYQRARMDEEKNG